MCGLTRDTISQSQNLHVVWVCSDRQRREKKSEPVFTVQNRRGGKVDRSFWKLRDEGKELRKEKVLILHVIIVLPELITREPGTGIIMHRGHNRVHFPK